MQSERCNCEAPWLQVRYGSQADILNHARRPLTGIRLGPGGAHSDSLSSSREPGSASRKKRSTTPVASADESALM